MKRQQNLVTALAAIFALISTQNIANFFTNLGHPIGASWTLGLAIGAALVILAYQLSEVDHRESKAFYGLLSVTMVLVTLSSVIQGKVYSDELGNLGYLLAFTLAATGEIVLPLAHSWTQEAKRRVVVNNAGSLAEGIAAETLVSVLGNIDTARAQRKAEQRIESLIVAHVDSIVTKLMPSDKRKDRHKIGIDPASSDLMPRQDADPMPTKPALADPVPRQDAESMPTPADQRRAKILDFLRTWDGLNLEDLNRSELARKVGASARTINRDLEALLSSGLISETDKGDLEILV